MAYALGRYSQGISVAKALTQGLGSKVKGALETTIELQPKHADAHIALGAFHAEVIDKVGKLLGKTQGADTATGLKMFKQALALNPARAIARVEYANGLVMLEGDKQMKEAEKLYAEAADCKPLDAMERLDVEMAKEELEDCSLATAPHGRANMPGRFGRRSPTRRRRLTSGLGPGQHQRHQQQLVELRLEALDDRLRVGAQLRVGDQAELHAAGIAQDATRPRRRRPTAAPRT